ncbi:MAG: hypothetical protein HYX87_06260 [Chloroflexi bacterium]|nr:hypothetical protein [Chloroflexota bacterium]
MRLRAMVILAAIVLSLSLFAGCSGAQGNKAQGVQISNVVFCSKEPQGYMQYVEQPNATYKIGDTVWVYMNIKGVKSIKNQDETNEVWIAENIAVKAPDGTTIVDQEVVNEHQNFAKEVDVDKLYLRNYISTSAGMNAGLYKVEITVSDKLAEVKGQVSTQFTLAQ